VYLVYGILFALIPILLGYGFALLLTKKNRLLSICIVCGIMTCTPAFNSMLTNKNDEVMYGAFSLTYAGALLAITIGIRIVALGLG
jgi:uncharacterized transporter YbjL